jgi:hypothetical protein
MKSNYFKLRLILAGLAASLAMAPASNLHAASPQDGVISVTDPAKIESHRSDFEKSLGRIGFDGKLASCQMVVKLRQDSRDESFGAICIRESDQRSIMLCDDSMIGKLTIKAYGFSETLEEVAYFTKTNCPGGG